MNKYKVEFNLKAQQKSGKPKYDFIFGQTEDSALEDAGIAREQIVGIYLLSVAQEQTLSPEQTYLGGPVDFPPPPSDAELETPGPINLEPVVSSE